MYESAATIDAPPEVVWGVLTDIAAWPSWESAVLRTEGTIAEGQKVKIWPEVNPDRAFPVKVTTLDAPRRMVFQGGMPLGLFRGTRTYVLEPTGTNQTRFHMQEVYTGLLSGMVTKSIPNLQPSFDTFARGLKSQAEARATA